jgi:hypothetical protein
MSSSSDTRKSRIGEHPRATHHTTKPMESVMRHDEDGRAVEVPESIWSWKARRVTGDTKLGRVLLMSARGPYGWSTWKAWLHRCKLAASPEYYTSMKKLYEARRLYNRSQRLTLADWRRWLDYCARCESPEFYKQEYARYLDARSVRERACVRPACACFEPKPPSGFTSFKQYLRHLKKKYGKSGIPRDLRTYLRMCHKLEKWEQTHKKRLL